MDTAREYIQKTKSAAKSLLAGIDSYIGILRGAPNPVLVESYPSDSARDLWIRENQSAIADAASAQRLFVSESLAMANLSGALLQIAAIGLRMHSSNEQIPDSVSDFELAPPLWPFCVGREVRRVPLGLIVYAGRNQYNHFDEENLRAPSSTIFERVANVESPFTGEWYRDPAFDLANGHRPRRLANNITALIDWRTYERYEADMKLMLGCED